MCASRVPCGPRPSLHSGRLRACLRPTPCPASLVYLPGAGPRIPQRTLFFNLPGFRVSLQVCLQSAAELRHVEGHNNGAHVRGALRACPVAPHRLQSGPTSIHMPLAPPPPTSSRRPSPRLAPRTTYALLGREQTPCPPPTSCSSVAPGRAPQPFPPLAMARAGLRGPARSAGKHSDPSNVRRAQNSLKPSAGPMQGQQQGSISQTPGLLRSIRVDAGITNLVLDKSTSYIRSTMGLTLGQHPSAKECVSEDPAREIRSAPVARAIL